MLLQNKYDISITNEILNEYEEIISTKYSVQVASNVIRTLLLLNNVSLINVYYKWQLIQSDKDYNKFVDCAIASNADYIVTNDKHFNILTKIDFTKVKCINTIQLTKIIEIL